MITGTTALRVALQFTRAQPLPLGQLRQHGRQILFEYEESFLSTGLEPSPLQLRAARGVFTEPKQLFDGLHGVFHDSLPDGWGRLLLDRRARSLGVDPALLTPLDRLACVGARGIGALVYEPALDLGQSGAVVLEKIVADARAVLAGRADDVLPELLRLGGSPAGARPKVLLSYRAADGSLLHGSEAADHRPILVKFASRSDPTDAGPIEYAYAQMAQAAGVEMMPTFLLHSSRRGPGHFATERFDLREGRRWHVHTLSGLLHADYRMPSLDYETALRAALHLTRDQRQVLRLYRVMVFNALAHNRDDHARQFSFLMGPDGQWQLTPAYDLTYSDGPGGEHATTIAGEGRAPGAAHFQKVAERLGGKPSQYLQIVDEVRAAVAQWPRLAAEAGVTRASQSRIWAQLKGAR